MLVSVLPRRFSVVVLVAMAAVLVGACAAPPPNSGLAFAFTEAPIAAGEPQQLASAITVASDTATVRVRVGTTVFGEVRICATVSEEFPSYGPRTQSCANAFSVAGTPMTVTLPLTSPTGTYPFEGFVAIDTSVKLPAVAVGRIDAESDATLGCPAFFRDEKYQCRQPV